MFGSAVTATAGGLLFTDDLDNSFLAIDAADGKTLYRSNTGGSVGGRVRLAAEAHDALRVAPRSTKEHHQTIGITATTCLTAANAVRVAQDRRRRVDSWTGDLNRSSITITTSSPPHRIRT